jgi:predicted RNA-binding protein associated with RNAse of E/G family
MHKNCKEVKRLLAGDEVIYECELIHIEEDFGILKYIFNKEFKIEDIIIHSGTVSYGFYWMNKPYNLYMWFDKSITAYYFNIADSIYLSRQKFVWRDLVVDVLVLPNGFIKVLDEEEIPLSIDKSLKDYIESGKKTILQNYKTIIQEANKMLEKLNEE